MATFYLDYEGGNDANDGTTFANRWKTFGSGATAARIAPGDEIRVMASPDPTLVGNATWTNLSKTVTLASAVTQALYLDGAWTASANVTCTTSTTCKQGSNSASMAIAAGFTTGLVAYYATGALDLSAYQQVTFWIRPSVAVAASTLSLRLCSDTAGAVTVNTIAIPALPAATTWVPITVDTGAALGASIQSIALYADLDPGTVTVLIDNVTACKASSAADSLTLTSLIGKVHNLSWTASTVYATGAKRRPTQPNRNGFQYEATTGGTSGSSEPAWPEDWGATVNDGTVVWTCIDAELEGTWHGLQSINGTTVMLDNGVSTLPTDTVGVGYVGTTETVATYKREAIKTPMVSASSTDIHTFQDSGTQDAPIVYSGGWNRTDMSTQSGETWFDGQNGNGRMFPPNFKEAVTLKNFGVTRANSPFSGTGANWTILNLHATNCTGGSSSSTTGQARARGVNFSNFGTALNFSVAALYAERVTTNSGSAGLDVGAFTNSMQINFWVLKNTSGGINTNTSPIRLKATNLVTANNSTAIQGRAEVQLVNARIAEANPFSGTTRNDVYISSHNHQKVVGSHLLMTDGGTIITATDQRHTASGISWKFRPTSTNRGVLYPMRLSVGKLYCAAGVSTTFSIWVRRDNTNIKGRILVRGGQILGVANDAYTDCQPAVNSWTQYSLSVTPTESGVIEVLFLVWDGVGTTNNLWIDDANVA